MKKAPDPRELKEEILAVRRGDQNAFAKLLARYTPLMESLVTKFFHSEASAVSRDDLCQEAMLVFYQSILTYDTEQTEVEFGLYAKICMTNALVSQLRAVRNRRVEPLSESETELLFVHDTEDPSYRILEQERPSALYAVIRSNLSDFEYRVWQAYMSGRSAAEIGRSLGKDEKSISNAVYRIRKKLRASLHNHE